MMTNRRHFLATCSAGVAGSLALQSSARSSDDSAEAVPGRKHPVVVFAKPLQQMQPEELGRRLKSIGVDGIEATLRKGGQIEPDNLGEETGRLCDSLARHDQRIVIAASDINQLNSATERQLRIFAKHDIPYFRMQYYRYDFSKPLLPQLERFARQASELADVCSSLGVTALYQNHAGKKYVGAALWDLEQVLAGIDPKVVALALDIRHATLELSQSWEAGYLAVRSHMGAVYVKDFAWHDDQPRNVPLGQGRSKPLFDKIARDGLVGPLSLHMEYIDHRQADLLEQRWAATRRDVQTLQRWLAARDA